MAVAIDWYDGDRGALRPLFELADDSQALLNVLASAGAVAGLLGM